VSTRFRNPITPGMSLALVGNPPPWARNPPALTFTGPSITFAPFSPFQKLSVDLLGVGLDPGEKERRKNPVGKLALIGNPPRAIAVDLATGASRSFAATPAEAAHAASGGAPVQQSGGFARAGTWLAAVPGARRNPPPEGWRSIAWAKTIHEIAFEAPFSSSDRGLYGAIVNGRPVLMIHRRFYQDRAHRWADRPQSTEEAGARKWERWKEYARGIEVLGGPRLAAWRRRGAARQQVRPSLERLDAYDHAHRQVEGWFALDALGAFDLAWAIEGSPHPLDWGAGEPAHERALHERARTSTPFEEPPAEEQWEAWQRKVGRSLEVTERHWSEEEDAPDQDDRAVVEARIAAMKKGFDPDAAAPLSRGVLDAPRPPGWAELQDVRYDVVHPTLVAAERAGLTTPPPPPPPPPPEPPSAGELWRRERDRWLAARAEAIRLKRPIPPRPLVPGMPVSAPRTAPVSPPPPPPPPPFSERRRPPAAPRPLGERQIELEWPGLPWREGLQLLLARSSYGAVAKALGTGVSNVMSWWSGGVVPFEKSQRAIVALADRVRGGASIPTRIQLSTSSEKTSAVLEAVDRVWTGSDAQLEAGAGVGRGWLAQARAGRSTGGRAFANWRKLVAFVGSWARSHGLAFDPPGLRGDPPAAPPVPQRAPVVSPELVQRVREGLAHLQRHYGSQGLAARELGISQPHYSNILRGHHAPSVGLASKILAYAAAPPAAVVRPARMPPMPGAENPGKPRRKNRDAKWKVPPKAKAIAIEEAQDAPYFDEAMRDARRFHGSEPTEAFVVRVKDGKPGVTRKAVAMLGTRKETVYEVPDSMPSNKNGVVWFHEHPDDAPPMIVKDPETGLTMDVGGAVVVDDWFYS
jgi:transcriptional regulator with XRE-family HTH domain